MDKWKLNLYKKGCLNFFQLLITNFRRDLTIQNRKFFILDRLKDHEFKNNSKTRRYQLYSKTSTNSNPTEKIFGTLRSPRSRPLRSQLRWSQSFWLQACRGKSFQLQFSRCNPRSGFSLESQSFQLQFQWSLFGGNRSGVVQSQWMHYSPSKHSTDDPSSPVSFWKGDL